MRTSTVVLVLIGLAAARAGAQAVRTPGHDAFDALYGERVVEAQRTRDAADDVQLATEILNGTALDGLEDSLRLVMFDQAWELSHDYATGYETALKSMQALENYKPAMAAEARSRIAQLELLRYSRAVRGGDRDTVAGQAYEAVLHAGEAYEAQLEFGEALDMYRRASRLAYVMGAQEKQHLQDIMRRASTLAAIRTRLDRDEKRYEGTQDAKLASEIAKVYLVDFDRPDRAEPWAKAGEDDDLRARIAQANIALDKIERDQARLLGQWYEALAGPAADHAKAAMLIRASRFYAHFLSLDEKEDALTLEVRLAQKRVNDQLAALGVDDVNALAGAIDLLPKLIRAWPVLMADQKQWKIDSTRQTVSCDIGDENWGTEPLVIPLVASGDYELLIKLDQEADACLIEMPLGGKMARFRYRADERSSLGGGPFEDRVRSRKPGKKDRLEHVGSFNLSAGPTKPREARTLLFKVSAQRDKATIEVKIDDEVALKWSGSTEKFREPYERRGKRVNTFVIRGGRGNPRIHTIQARGKLSLMDVK